MLIVMFFFSSRRRHTRYWRDWSSDVCSSDLRPGPVARRHREAVLAQQPHVLPERQAAQAGEQPVGEEDAELLGRVRRPAAGGNGHRTPPGTRGVTATPATAGGPGAGRLHPRWPAPPRTREREPGPGRTTGRTVSGRRGRPAGAPVRTGPTRHRSGPAGRT